MLPADVWAAHDKATPYAPAEFAEEGFVHATDGDAGMVATANRFYRDDARPFVVLTVDLDATGSPWRFDDPEQRFPHIYGTIAPAAVLEVRRLTRDADGGFTGIVPID
jgi:glutathione S-transferase